MMPQQSGGALPAVPAPLPERMEDRRNHLVRDRLRTRLEGEFRDMPGLRLTPAQASRLLGLEPSACGRLLRLLVERGFLRTTPSGQYVRLPSPR